MKKDTKATVNEAVEGFNAYIEATYGVDFLKEGNECLNTDVYYAVANNGGFTTVDEYVTAYNTLLAVGGTPKEILKNLKEYKAKSGVVEVTAVNEAVEKFETAKGEILNPFSVTIEKLQRNQVIGEDIAKLKEERETIENYFERDFRKHFQAYKEAGNTPKEALTLIFNGLESSYTLNNGDLKDYNAKILAVYRWYYLESSVTVKKEVTDFKSLQLLKKCDGYYSKTAIKSLMKEDHLPDYKSKLKNILNYAERLRNAIKGINHLSEKEKSDYFVEFVAFLEMKGSKQKISIKEGVNLTDLMPLVNAYEAMNNAKALKVIQDKITA